MDEIKLNKKEKAFLFTLCVFLNVFGKFVSAFIHMPLWLDTIGTCISAYFLGPLWAIAVGALNNIIFGFSVHSEFVYASTSIIIALVFTLCMRKKYFQNFTKVLISGFMVGLIATLVNTPITILMFKGGTGNMWGDGIYEFLIYKNYPVVVSTFLSNLLLDIVDKQISAVIAYLFIRRLHNNYLKLRGRENGQKMMPVAMSFFVVMTIVFPLIFAFHQGAIPSLKTVAQNMQNASLEKELAAYSASTNEIEIPVNGTLGAGDVFDGSCMEIVYNNTNGLFSSEANAIAQTDDGYIWVGSYAGLTRFDGNKFNYIHEQNLAAITNLLTDRHGRLWIGTNDNGVVCYDHGVYTPYTEADGLPSATIRSMALSYDGGLYIGTARGLCKLSEDGKCETIGGNIGTIVSLDINGDLLFAVNSSGDFYVLKDDEVYASLSMDGKTFTCVRMAEDGIWLGTSESQLIRVELDGGEISVQKTVAAGKMGYINALYVDRQDRLWVAATGGLGYLDSTRRLNAHSFERFPSSISNVFQDVAGNIWFTSTRYGVMELAKNRFVNLLHNVGYEEQTANCVLRKDGIVYVGTEKGICIFSEYTGKHIENELTKLLEGMRVRCIIADSKNNIWICSYGNGLVKVSSDGKIKCFTEKEGAVSNYVRCAYELNDGRIAAGTPTGLMVLQNDQIIATVTEEDGLENAQVLCIADGISDRILIGSDGAGIYVIENGKIIDNVTVEDGLTSNVIMRLVPYGNGYFAVTSNCLCFVKGSLGTSCARVLTNFPYYNNFDLLLHEDKAYVLSSTGLYITDAESLAADAPSDYTLFGYNEGLTDSITSNSWNEMSPNGDLYMCTNAGVAFMDARYIGDVNKVYSFGMEYVAVDGKDVLPEGVVYNIPADAYDIALSPSVRNYDRNGLRLTFYVEDVMEESLPISSRAIEPIHLSNLKGGIYKVWINIYADDKNTIVNQKCYLLNKELYVWEYAWFVVYIVLMLLWVIFSLLWSIIMFRVEGRKKQEMDNYRMQAKNEFMANMSHEIITPVNAILGMNALILRESENRKIEGYAKNIDTNCNVLLGLLRGVIDYSSIEDGKMSFTNSVYSLPGLISDIMSMTKEGAAQKGLSITTEVEENAPTELEGDIGRIRQMTGNLVSNAVKYTKQGSIQIKVWTIPYDEFAKNRSFAERKEEYREDGYIEGCDTVVCISVKDTGIGIKEKNLDKIFENFSNKDAKTEEAVRGTGLGLAITKGIANMMGGDIKVTSEYGVGSTFTLRIPQHDISKDKIGNFEDAKKEAEEKSKESAFAAPTARILCVDDNETNLAVVKGLLKRLQIIPVLVTSGAEALKETNLERYDLIIMDHMMPEMDGVECMKLIREDKHNSNKDTPIIVCTANALPGMREEYLKDGFDEFLGKPVEGSVLEQMLLKYLPKQKIKMASEKEEQIKKATGTMKMSEDGQYIDRSIGLGYSGGDESVYLEVLSSYVSQSEKYLMDLPMAVMNKDWSTYTVEAHALKSTSKTIGAMSFSSFALRMENAAKEEDAKTIETNHEFFIEEYRKVLDEALLLLPQKVYAYDRKSVAAEEYTKLVKEIQTALEEYDMTRTRTAYEQLNKVTADSARVKAFEKKISMLDDAIKKYDYEGALSIAKEY